MTITCTLHPRPKEMQFGEVTLKDGTKQKLLTCPRCFRTVKVTPEMETKLKEIEEKERQVVINTGGGDNNG